MEEEEEEEKASALKTFLLGFYACSKRLTATVVKSSPVAPCEEVADLLKLCSLTPGHLLTIYGVFHRLAQSETDQIVWTAHEIEAETVVQLVQRRRRWVARMLRALLRLGGIEMDGTITWDEFVWILIRFCSLTECELVQTLFMIIGNELDSPTHHYLTKDQLHDFFFEFNTCPIKSFNTDYIDFEKLPLSRYYVTDLVELATRYRQLLNPMVHLQASIQSHLPGQAFWDFCDALDFTRRISLEFFTMRRVRIHLRGEPPFRETCDMLGPDALGAERLNQDQWYLRVRGLKQYSVWGEQFTPEQAEAEEHRQMQERLAAERELAAHEAKKQENLLAGLAPPPDLPPNPALQKKKKKDPFAVKPPDLVLPPGVSEPVDIKKVPAFGAPPGQTQGAPGQLANAPGTTGAPGASGAPMAPGAAAGTAAASANLPGSVPGAPSNTRGSTAAHLRAAAKPAPQKPSDKCYDAAALDESDYPPQPELPPIWMREHTVAPAPAQRAPDPPLWRMRQLGMQYQEAYNPKITPPDASRQSAMPSKPITGWDEEDEEGYQGSGSDPAQTTKSTFATGLIDRYDADFRKPAWR